MIYSLLRWQYPLNATINSEPSSGRREFGLVSLGLALTFVATILRFFLSVCELHHENYSACTAAECRLWVPPPLEHIIDSNVISSCSAVALVRAMRSLAGTCMGDSRLSRQTRTHTHTHSRSTLSLGSHIQLVFSTFGVKCVRKSRSLSLPLSPHLCRSRCAMPEPFFHLRIWRKWAKRTAGIVHRERERKRGSQCLHACSCIPDRIEWKCHGSASLDRVRPTQWETKCNEWYKGDEANGCRCRCCCAIVVSRLKCFSTENKRRSRSGRISSMVE